MTGTIMIQSAHGVLSSIEDPSKTFSAPLPSFNPAIEELPENPLNKLSEQDLRDFFAGQPEGSDANTEPTDPESDAGKAPAESAPNVDAPAEAPVEDPVEAPVEAPVDAPATAPAAAPAAAKTTTKAK